MGLGVGTAGFSPLCHVTLSCHCQPLGVSPYDPWEFCIPAGFPHGQLGLNPAPGSLFKCNCWIQLILAGPGQLDFSHLTKITN